MKIIKCKNKDEIGIKAAEIIIKKVKDSKNTVLGFATGSTPIETYKNIVKDRRNNNTDWSNVVTFNLDEYIGLDYDHEQSYKYFMNKHLFSELNISPDNINFPKVTGNISENCLNYEKLLNKNKIEIQLLGIGSNGHIAFNEPGTCFDSITHETNLTESTINDNSIFFDNKNDVPTKAITMGISSILKAKTIILLAYGLKKADAIKELIEGKINTKWTCTLLQKHDDVTVIIDEEAASKLRNN